jgi:serine/threonine protein kinase
MTEREIFIAALQNEDPAQRQAYLDEICAGHPDLRRQVEHLLRLFQGAGSFLEEPAAESLATGAFPDTAELASSPEVPGAVLGPYKLLEPIGEGGMGTVWLAQQTEPVKRLVAVKLIKAGMDSKQVIARFEAERQALALMDHPNIARVLDAGTTGAGRPYFVMDLVKGVPITRHCDEHRLTPRQRLELFVPVCQAVQHAHQKAIVHRDLKPSNVLVATSDGRPLPKVIDFGVAKATGQALTEKTLVTGFGTIVGTLEYMSPEQAEADQLDIDTRSDIYSLGVLLYELLTGTPPFTRKELKQAGMLEILRLIREQQPPVPSTKLSTAEGLPTLAANRGTEPAKLRKLLRGELDWIVMKALEKDRNRRYETANGFAMDLQRYLADEPVQAGPPSATYRLRKFIHRNRGLVLAGALMALTLVLGIAGTTVGLVLAEQARGLAEGKQLQAEQAAAAEAAQRAKADESAVKERQAKVQAEKRLAQIEKGIVLLEVLFENLDPRAVEKQDRPLQAILGDRLDKAAKELDAEGVGDPLAVARLQHILGLSLQALGYPEKAVVVLDKARQTRATHLPADHPDTLDTMNHLAVAYHDAGQLEQALPLYQETLAKRKASLPRDDPATLESMNNLAVAYEEAGWLELALPLYEEVLEKRKASFGTAALSTLTSMNNLALAYQAAGHFDQALKLLLETLEKTRDRQGKDHPDTLECMNNLAAAYRDAGQLDLAMPLYVEALEKQKAKQGAEHPSTLATMHNLAVAYQSAGRFDLALPLTLETLRKQEGKLGAEHPSTLSTKNNLAEIYRQTGQLDLAVPLYLEVLQIRKTKLAANHPSTLTTMNNLALAYRDAGQLDKALSLFLETLEKRKARQGADHPSTLQSMSGLALTYQAAGKGDLALALCLETFEKSRARLGADHPQTLKSMNNLAFLYEKAGQRHLALPLYLDALWMQRAKLPADHPDTLTTLNNLAVSLYEADNLDLALPLFLETVQKQKATLGAEHPQTLKSMNNLAVAYRTAGQLDQALPLGLEVLQKQKARLGPEHPETLHSMNNLAVTYLDAGKLELALPLIVEACEKISAKLGPNHPRSQDYAKNLTTTLKMIRNRALDHFGNQNYADAEALLAAWLVVQRPHLSAEDIDLAFTLNILGECQVMQGRYGAAEKALRESLAIYEKNQPKAFMRYDTESLLGAALAGQKAFAEAEPLLVGSAKVLLANYGKLSPGNQWLAVAAGQRVIALYDAWKRPEEAATWRKWLNEVQKKTK